MRSVLPQLSTLLLSVLAFACAAQEPAATAIKRKMAERNSQISGGGASQSADATSGDGLALKGEEVYQNLCVSCHNDAATSTAAGASQALLDGLLDDPQYGAIHRAPFSSLAAGDTAALAVFLNPESETDEQEEEKESSEPDAAQLALTGKQLYESTCIGCHGAIANSTATGASASRLKGLPTDSEYGMSHAGPFASLNDSDFQALEAYLNQ